MTSISAKVAERLSNISPAVEEAVVVALVEVEKARMVETLMRGVQKFDKDQDTLNRMKPDTAATFDNEGNEVTPATWSKGALDARNKAASNLEKLGNAIDKAIEGDMDQLEKLLKGGN